MLDWNFLIGIAVGLIVALIPVIVFARQQLTQQLLPRKIEAISNLYAALITLYSRLQDLKSEYTIIATPLHTRSSRLSQGPQQDDVSEWAKRLHEYKVATFERTLGSLDTTVQEFTRARALATIYIEDEETIIAIAEATIVLVEASVSYIRLLYDAALPPIEHIDPQTLPAIDWDNIKKKYEIANKALQRKLNPAQIKRLV